MGRPFNIKYRLIPSSVKSIFHRLSNCLTGTAIVDICIEVVCIRNQCIKLKNDKWFDLMSPYKFIDITISNI